MLRIVLTFIYYIISKPWFAFVRLFGYNLTERERLLRCLDFTVDAYTAVSEAVADCHHGRTIPSKNPKSSAWGKIPKIAHRLLTDEEKKRYSGLARHMSQSGTNNGQNPGPLSR